MAVALTPLQTFDGPRVTLVAPRKGWRVDSEGLDIALGEPADIAAGSYEARGRASTAHPGRGTQIALEVYILALEGGSLCAVRTGDGSLSA